jgi:hypothetical protein
MFSAVFCPFLGDSVLASFLAIPPAPSPAPAFCPLTSVFYSDSPDLLGQNIKAHPPGNGHPSACLPARRSLATATIRPILPIHPKNRINQKTVRF